MNWLKYKNLYFIVSILMLSIGIFSLWKYGLSLGIDFTGGTVIEYSIDKEVEESKYLDYIKQNGYEVHSFQKTQDNTYLLKFPPLQKEDSQKIASISSEFVGQVVDQVKLETVGPSIGPELVRKTFYAIAIASVVILLWVAYQFRSIKFGVSAIVAMFHDTLILIGAFSILGHYYSAEVDFLFVTAVLTTLSFSVHDTIVVFDRIREIQRKEGGFLDIVANRALSETMVRSLNNSFTIIFMLVALIILGGTSIRWFAASLLVGTILGTYSSPFVAVPLLSVLDRGLFKKS